MKKIWSCRRSIIGLVGIACLTFLGYTKGLDVSMALSGVVLAIASSNAYEKSKTNGSQE